MNVRLERRLFAWLAERDPGPPPARLRAAIADVPYSVRPNAWPLLDRAMVRLVGPWTPTRAAALLLIVLATLVAVAGAVVVHPWDVFPPRGLIAYTVPLEQIGSTGIRLIAADGTGARQITAPTANIYEHSPRWSSDGRTLLFARTTDLDPLSPCLGVGSIVVHDIATGTERIVATDLRPTDAVEWSPTGDRVAYTWPPLVCGMPAGLAVVDVATGRATTSQLRDGAWRVRWEGEAATAVDAHAHETPSRDRSFVAVADTRVPGCDFCDLVGRDVRIRLALVDETTGSRLELGAGGAGAWSPDDGAFAFVEFVDRPSELGLEFRDHLVIVTRDGATWQVRTLGDVLLPDLASQASAFELPTLHWGRDGRTIYWIDVRGGHVVDVASGRAADLPAALNGSHDLQWQPVPS